MYTMRTQIYRILVQAVIDEIITKVTYEQIMATGEVKK